MGESGDAALVEQAEQFGRRRPATDGHLLIFGGADDAGHPALCEAIAHACEVDHASTRPCLVDALAELDDSHGSLARQRAFQEDHVRVEDVGLGYLSLGQPLTTLSGGERQRLKLATHMAEKAGVYVLDEPTTGLHLADVEQLLGLLDRLVDSGKSVIIIEHHQAVMARGDWIIDLGPGAGHEGGRVVFEGTPGDLVAARSTLTGEHLADYVS